MYQVRDGQQVAVTCPECGCRLEETSYTPGKYAVDTYFYHYWPEDTESDKPLRDAAGCNCSIMTGGLFIKDGKWQRWFTRTVVETVGPAGPDLTRVD